MTAPGPAPGKRPVVWACVVSYRADPVALRRLVAVLEPQVARVVVVDNAADASAADPAGIGPAMYVPMDRNRGTAGAMNEAWRLALEAGADYLVSFDQDSQPGPGIVEGLLAAFAAPSAPPLAAVGPAWTDARTGKPMRLLKPVTFRRVHVPAPAQGLVEVDHVITSGCMIGAAVYRNVGPFDEDLFLDYVDVEWSLRARARGYANAIAVGTTMTHAIGEKVIALRGRQLAVHKPERTYLQLRNHLLLWRRAWIPRLWLLSDLGQVIAKQLALVVLAPRRAQRLRCMFSGLVHGLQGKGQEPAGWASSPVQPGR